MKQMLSFLTGGAIAFATMATADEVIDNLQYAIEAFQEGDIAEAKELVDYVNSLLAEFSEQAFARALPDAMPGWTKEEMQSETAEGLAFLGGGGGSAVMAQYVNEAGAALSIELVADSPLVAMQTAQFSNPSVLSAMGEVKRINRETVLITNEGDLQALIDNRFLITIAGNASQDDKIAYFEAIDFETLEDM